MLYFVYSKTGITEVTSDHTKAHSIKGSKLVITRSDIKSIGQANAIALQATALKLEQYVAADRGPNVWPRFDVIRAPKVGDKVSYGIGGDAYEDGFIVKVSDSLRRVESSNGTVYWRRKQSDTWRSGSRYMILGAHVNRLDPHF